MQPDQQTINILKGLIMDGVRNTDSGHTGGAMSSSDFAYLLFQDYLSYDPDDPQWFNRDRFILSAGHESMLLYSLLTMIGFLTVDDLRNFRSLDSRTPGHPEVETPGVEATTGPLGQGVGMGIGMAVAETILAQMLGDDVMNHYTYILAGDGDLQEPVCLGAAELAGHFRLGKVIMYYDRNQVQISGHTSRADSTDFGQVFNAMGWHVQVIDGHDHKAIHKSIRSAQGKQDQPSLIIGNTTMAAGTASMEGQAATHGAPLPPEEIAATKIKLNLPDTRFYLPETALFHFRGRQPALRKAAQDWNRLIEERGNDGKWAETWRQTGKMELPAINLPAFKIGQSIPTRKAFGAALAALADQLPNLIGGSADLEPSNNTGAFMEKVGDYTARSRSGRNLAFGVREFPMATIMNGTALHGGLRSFGATFLVFSDYEKPALRLRALQQLPVLAIYTHDSFYLGKDGPTHQPVEHLWALRAIPNFLVLRPADAVETTVLLKLALEQTDRPSALVLSRQGLPVLTRLTGHPAELAARGAYIIQDCDSPPEIILIASGSEVSLALEATALLSYRTRVVSMPCCELFDEQERAYRHAVLPPEAKLRVSIEAGATTGWGKYTGLDGLQIGVDRFGVSADPAEIAELLGFTPGAVVKRIQDHMQAMGQNA